MGYAYMDRVGAEQISGRLAQLGSDENERECRHDQAAALFDRLFNNFNKDGEWLSKWVHAPVLDVARDQSLNWYTQDLRSAAETYLEDAAWLQCREMDWLIADMLTYAEVASTFRAMAGVPLSFGSKAEWGVSLLRLSWRVAKWIVWLAITLILGSTGTLWLIGWLGLTVLQQTLKWRARHKTNALLFVMLDVYQSLDTTSPSWEHTWGLLVKSRSMGAVWPTPLYRLVEDRK